MRDHRAAELPLPSSHCAIGACCGFCATSAPSLPCWVEPCCTIGSALDETGPLWDVLESNGDSLERALSIAPCLALCCRIDSAEAVGTPATTGNRIAAAKVATCNTRF